MVMDVKRNKAVALLDWVLEKGREGDRHLKKQSDICLVLTWLKLHETICKLMSVLSAIKVHVSSGISYWCHEGNPQQDF